MNTGKCMATWAFLVTYLVRLPTSGLERFAELIAASSALQDRVVLLVSGNENLGRPRRCVEEIDREVAGHIRLIRLPRDLRRIRMLVDLHSVASCSLQ